MWNGCEELRRTGKRIERMPRKKEAGKRKGPSHGRRAGAGAMHYDDVFRTMLNDCRQLIIPLVNEAFGERYAGDEEIVLLANELFLKQKGGKESKRITDTSFIIRTKTEGAEKSIIGSARAAETIRCWCGCLNMIRR